MNEWRKTRRKPEEVEVWGPWNGLDRNMPAEVGFHRDMTGRPFLSVPTLDSTEFVDPGDYIIRRADGRLQVYRPNVFEATFEPCD